MVESRYVLYSLISGLIAGSIGGVLAVMVIGNSFKDFIYSLTYHQLMSAGLPSNNASSLAKSIFVNTGGIIWLLPLGTITNMVFLGVLMGLLMDYLVKKGLRPSVAVVISGCVLIFGLQIGPLYLLTLYYGNWFLQLFMKYVKLWVLLAPSIIFTVALMVLTGLKGPWTKLEESKPEIY